MLKEIGRLLDLTEDEKTHQFVSRLYNLLCYFIKKGDLTRSSILSENISDELFKKINSSPQVDASNPYQPFYQSFDKLSQALKGYDTAEHKGFKSLQHEIDAITCEVFCSPTLIGRLQFFIKSAKQFIVGQIDTKVTDELIPGESSVSLAMKLYIEVNEYIDDRETLFNPKDESNYQDWRIVSFAKFLWRQLDSRNFFSENLTKQRVTIARQLEDRVFALLVQNDCQDPLIFPAMLLLALDYSLGKNEFKTKLNQQQESLVIFSRNGIGALHKKMYEYRDKFAAIFCALVERHEKAVSPKARELKDKLVRGVEIKWGDYLSCISLPKEVQQEIEAQESQGRNHFLFSRHKHWHSTTTQSSQFDRLVFTKSDDTELDDHITLGQS